MLFVRFALLTCVIYLAIALLLDIAFAVISNYKGGAFVGGGIGLWASIFGVVWAVSFTASFYILNASIRAKVFPR